jgi:hypothetical protein
VLACAFAPAVPAHETAAKSDDGCGCGHNCCGTNDCAMPPAPARTATTTTLNVVGAVEARVTVARPTRRATNVGTVSIFRISSGSPARAWLAPRTMALVASAPLFRLHCTFLI